MSSVVGFACVAVISAGFAAAAATDLLLAAAGAAEIAGPEIGVIAAPLAGLGLPAPVRRILAANVGWALLVFGAAWSLAAVIDQHLSGGVIVSDGLAHRIHHAAGLVALFASIHLVRRPEATPRPRIPMEDGVRR